jgi:hypothetical protein
MWQPLAFHCRRFASDIPLHPQYGSDAPHNQNYPFFSMHLPIYQRQEKAPLAHVFRATDRAVHGCFPENVSNRRGHIACPIPPSGNAFPES